jgi:hypothetical protein
VPAAPSAPASADFFGVSTNGEVIHNEELRALAILGGVQMVRTSVNWNDIEKTKGEYKWGGADGTLGPLLDNNLTPLVLVLNNAEWASNSPCGPVNDLPAFGVADQLINRRRRAGDLERKVVDHGSERQTGQPGAVVRLGKS